MVGPLVVAAYQFISGVVTNISKKSYNAGITQSFKKGIYRVPFFDSTFLLDPRQTL